MVLEMCMIYRPISVQSGSQDSYPDFYMSFLRGEGGKRHNVLSGSSAQPIMKSRKASIFNFSKIDCFVSEDSRLLYLESN